MRRRSLPTTDQTIEKGSRMRRICRRKINLTQPDRKAAITIVRPGRGRDVCKFVDQCVFRVVKCQAKSSGEFQTLINNGRASLSIASQTARRDHSCR